jgi:5-methylcytosine-specific restriction endonuclease McrA
MPTEQEELAAIRAHLRNIEALLSDFISAYMGGLGNFKEIYKDKRAATHRRGAGGYHSPAEWKALKVFYEYKCLCCGRQEPEITLTRDHVIPPGKPGHTNDITNIQPICETCNAAKGDKAIDYRVNFIPPESRRPNEND